MLDRLRLILFAHARSGSSSLYQILQLHPQLHILEEPFNEGFTRWHPQAKNYLELINDTASLDAQLAEIFASYNGVKVLEYQLPQPLYVHMLRRPDCTIIFLRRRNLLQAVVSNLIAEQTHLWKTWDMERPLQTYYANLQALSIADIKDRVASLKQRLDFFEAIISSRPANSYFKLVYEDLYLGSSRQREVGVARIWQFLHLEPIDSDTIQQYLSPERAKLNSIDTYQLLPNAHEIDQQLGNNETGWLF